MDGGAEEVEYYLEAGGLADTPARYALDRSPVVIGRASQADIRLLRTAVSRQHCEFVLDPMARRWWLRDLRSHNGTRVNGQPIVERLLVVGDVIQVGDASFTLRAMRTAATEPIPAADARTIAAPPSENQSHTTSLREVRPPSLSAGHLESLMALHRRLLEIESRIDRMTELSRTLAGDEFHGQTVVVVRINRDGDDLAIRQVSEPQAADGPADTPPYYSTTLLRAVRERCEPTMASWADHSFGSLEVTQVDHMKQRAAMACPLDDDAQAMHVLYIVAPAPYARGEWLALADLAAEQYRQADRAWNARRLEAENAAFHRELELARTMQLQFIPQHVHIDGVEIAIGYEPCRWVGGDYIDVMATGDGRVLLAIADVCGKGVQAALITASLHTMLHSALAAGLDLKALIKSLNQYLCATLTGGSFVTMQCVEIDLATGKTTCLNAGHPPAMVIGPSGIRRIHAATNLPLGVELMEPQSHVDQLHPGELLAMYTDGLTEMADTDGKMLGIDGLGNLMRAAHDETPNQPLEETRQSLIDRLEALRDGRMPLDDQTFLLARRC